jgi:cell division septum initiation protein DivIVA
VDATVANARDGGVYRALHDQHESTVARQRAEARDVVDRAVAEVHRQHQRWAAAVRAVREELEEHAVDLEKLGRDSERQQVERVGFDVRRQAVSAQLAELQQRIVEHRRWLKGLDIR